MKDLLEFRSIMLWISGLILMVSGIAGLLVQPQYQVIATAGKMAGFAILGVIFLISGIVGLFTKS